MPLYEYECRKCHHRFERIQQFSDKPVRRCPKCKTGRVEKLISSPAVHFKGTGWYVTDYARGGGNGKTETKPETPAKPAETKTESKPAPAADSGSKS